MDVDSTVWFLAGTIVPSLLIAWLAGFAVRRWAPAWGLVDQPGHRKVHTAPTPLGGGLAIWMGVMATFAGGAILLWLASRQPDLQALLPGLVPLHLPGLQARAASLLLVLACGTALMLVGLIDDRWGLDWKIRIGVQFAAAVVCVATQPQCRLTAFIEGLQPLTWLLSVVWIVGLINSFNMLDNMDGASAGVAAIASGMLAVFLLAPGGTADGPQLFVAGFLLVLVGALLGFLWHNRPRARIFMGDAGSYFIGFSIAIATLLATYTGYHSSTQHAILAPVFVMAVPIYDTITVLWIRIREGRSLVEADKNHFSHRLVDLGLTKGQAVLTIYLTTATCGLGAILLHRVDLFGAGIIALLVLCVLALIHILETTAWRKLNQ